MSCQEAVRFGSTISEQEYHLWLSNIQKELESSIYFIYDGFILHSSNSLLLKRNFPVVKLVDSISRCFYALGLHKNSLELRITLYSICYTPLDQWKELCDACLAANELVLAGRCCSIALCTNAPNLGDTSSLDDNQRQYLLDLWFLRSCIFELQGFASKSRAAIRVYARLTDEFEIQSLSKKQKISQAMKEDPISYYGRQRLLEKKEKRLALN